MKKQTKIKIFASLLALSLTASGFVIVKANETNKISNNPYIRMVKILEFKGNILNSKQNEKNILNIAACKETGHNYKIINPKTENEYCLATLLCYNCATKVNIKYKESCHHNFILDTNEKNIIYNCKKCDSQINININNKYISNDKINYICTECNNIKEINERDLSKLINFGDYKLIYCNTCNKTTKFKYENKKIKTKNQSFFISFNLSLTALSCFS